MPRRKKPEPAFAAGTFEPAVPTETQEVVQLFLIGARAVCQRPDLLETITERLGSSVGDLLPPESFAAQECGKLWMAFARVAASSKATLLAEAGRALYRDLEALAQRLDLPPLQDWHRIPVGIDSATSASSPVREARADLDAVKERAAARVETLGTDGHLPGLEVATLLTEMDPHARDALFKHLVGDGIVARGDCTMVAQTLLRGSTITEEDRALLEVLEQMGDWLTGAPPAAPNQARS